MSRLGIVCGTLVIIGLLVEFWLVAKLGYRRAEVGEKLREATVKSEKAVAEFDRAAADLRTAEVNLAALKLGWGYEFQFAPANPAPVQNQGGKLFVTGLGSSTAALQPRKVTVLTVRKRWRHHRCTSLRPMGRETWSTRANSCWGSARMNWVNKPASCTPHGKFHRRKWNPGTLTMAFASALRFRRVAA